ncbi:helix-turn-helix transcriptional regulator [Inquilinus limosus]|uniref:helix-turn-helix transcriptional regulator n=1 Tax=Inquilinus limosus TaxID=171674 RepID=UPI0003F7A0A0|nr:helix-turn-helix transcriptional regulator [Inquilinus limosus]
MTAVAQAILRTVQRIYDAAMEPEAWPHCLDAVRDLVGGSHAVFTTTTVDGVQLSTCSRMDVRQHGERCDRILHSDFWAEQMRRFPTGTARTQSSMVPVRVYERTDFYQQLIRPIGGGLAAVAVPWRGPSGWSAIRVCRPLHERDFGAEELGRLQVLVPHLAKAGKLNRRLASVDPLTTGALAAIDALGLGLILLDRHGRPVYRNERAEAVIAARDGLLADAYGLATTLPAQTRALHQAITAAMLLAGGPDEADAALGRGAAALLRIPVSRRPPNRPLILTVVPAPGPGRGPAPGEPGAVAVLISDPDRCGRIDTAGLASAYGLTRRESALAALIADGLGPAEAAESLGISIGTARHYLKQVFEKTETHRQAELVRLLLHSFAAPDTRAAAGR